MGKTKEKNLNEMEAEGNLASGIAAHDPQGNEPDDQRRIFLREWLASNELELRTALRPVGGALAEIRGLTGADATADLLVEVARIALAQAYVHYDLRYPSPRLWLLKIASFVGRRWREEARIARRRQGGWTLGHPSESASNFNDEDALARIAGPDSDDPVHVVDQIWLQHRLDHLSPEDRGIIQCRIIEQLSFAEAAENLEITEGAARVRFFRAIKRLRLQEDEENAKQENEYRSGRLVIGKTPQSAGSKQAEGTYNEEAHE